LDLSFDRLLMMMMMTIIPLIPIISLHAMDRDDLLELTPLLSQQYKVALRS